MPVEGSIITLPAGEADVDLGGAIAGLAGPVGAEGFASAPNLLARAAARSSSTETVAGGPIVDGPGEAAPGLTEGAADPFASGLAGPVGAALTVDPLSSTEAAGDSGLLGPDGGTDAEARGPLGPEGAAFSAASTIEVDTDLVGASGFAGAVSGEALDTESFVVLPVQSRSRDQHQMRSLTSVLP